MTKTHHKKSNKIKTILLSFLLMFACFFSCLNINTTYAGTIPTEPGIEPDYTLFFKDLKEENGAVYVYVNQYEYSDIIYASSINISTDLENLKIKNYKLEFVEKTLLSTATNNYYLGTYTYKYLIKDLPVYESSKRVYEVISIYRPYSWIADGVYPEGSNVPTEIVFPVEKCYTYLTNKDGTTSLSIFEIETIYITDKFVGFVRYLGGFLTVNYSCDRHFVAFSTDKQIDTLREVDVYYTTQDITNWLVSGGSSFGTKNDEYSYLTSDGRESIQSGFLWLNKYTWNDIQTTSEFIAGLKENKVYSGGVFDKVDTTEITNNLESTLANMTHVLNFATTKYSSNQQHNGLTMDYKEQYTKIADVSILRLKFETGGYTFEYGAIDDKTTGSDKPVGTVGTTSSIIAGSNIFDNIFAWFQNIFANAKKILIIVLIVIILLFLFPLIVSIFPAIASFLVAVFKAILKAITGLINLILRLFGGGK